MLKPDHVFDAICPWCGAVNEVRIPLTLDNILRFAAMVLGMPLNLTVICKKCAQQHRGNKPVR